MIRRLAQEWRLGWTALEFLTRLPSPSFAGFDPSWLAGSLLYFPLVGALVGGVCAGIYLFAGSLWAPLPAATLAVAGAALLTGGLHEDGFADFFDALASGRDRERMLAVMRDSRIGAAGALALVLLVAGRIGAIAALPPTDAWRVLVAALALSRWTSLPLAWRLPYARPAGGLGSPLAGRVTTLRVLAGTALAAAIAGLALGPQAWLAGAIAMLVALAAGALFRQRLGGVTGDCLGAAIQLTELALLLGLSAHLPVRR